MGFPSPHWGEGWGEGVVLLYSTLSLTLWAG